MTTAATDTTSVQKSAGNLDWHDRDRSSVAQQNTNDSALYAYHEYPIVKKILK